MSKQIAVFICAISFDNQRRILEGILECAKKRDVNVFVFTCHLNYMEKKTNKQGAYNIMNLPDLTSFDGVILVKNTIQYKSVADMLVERIKESGTCAISIDEHLPDIPYVGISSYSAQRKLIEHMIFEHSCKRMNYVAGQITNQEGMERYQAYKDILSEHGIPYDEQRVYYGNYDIDSGRKAVIQFLDTKAVLPEVIICANDSMALGVIAQLEEYGYQVPKDIAVTGFDNDEVGRLYSPSITTIDRNQKNIGYQALQELLQKSDEFQDYEIDAEVIIGSSCGCSSATGYTLKKTKQMYVEKSIIIQQAVDCTKNMVTELAGLERMEDLYEILKKYVFCSDMESFYLCLCDEEAVFKSGNMEKDNKIDITDINTSYTQYVSIPLAYEDKKFGCYSRFLSGQVLPKECKAKKKSSFYIITPVYYQNCCFGYCVSENSYFALRSELFYSWVINIGIGMENIRKWILLNRMVQKLNGMWQYDMLTHLYSRTGFFYFSDKMLKEIKRQQADVFIIFIDLDGLKKINDALGHEQGDCCICEMADVLRETVGKENLVMRYGGDEFVVFGRCRNEKIVRGYITAIQSNMNMRNQTKNRVYLLASSIGYSCYKAKEIENLSGLIEKADRMMYEEKRKKGKR